MQSSLAVMKGANMFQNYVMIAVRNIGRDKLFSLINLGGLAASLSACLLIFLFVWSELNFDNWVTDGERIYRVEATYSPMGREPVPATTVGGPMRAAPRHWARF